MDSDKYREGQSMQRPPLFESDCFIYWKNRFETYVKSKDLDIWQIILNGDFLPVARNKETQVLEVVSFEQQDDDLKRKLAKNNEAKYERIFMCKTAKDIWQSLLITHQGNCQVKGNKIDLLVLQYEQFTILEEESINSDFARFNTIITSLKALDEGFSSKNYVRKFLRALHPKWRANVMMIEESKDLSSLALDELIENQKKESSDDETSLMAQSSNEVTLDSSHYSDNASSLDDDRSGYQQKDRKPSPRTKLRWEWKQMCKIQGHKSKKCQSQTSYENQQSKPDAGTEEYIESNLNPSDGPGKAQQYNL
ncbi:hypothetical protein Tco_0685871 [Tanacetum coccineum]